MINRGVQNPTPEQMSSYVIPSPKHIPSPRKVKDVKVVVFDDNLSTNGDDEEVPQSHQQLKEDTPVLTSVSLGCFLFGAALLA